MGALGRRLRALERRIGDSDFKGSAPPLDADGLPNWDGCEPLSVEGYMRALGFEPDEQLTDSERDARTRLAPYAHLFAEMDDPSRAGGSIAT